MNYTKNMWDTWKDFRLDEQSDDLTKLFEEFQKAGIDEFSAYGKSYSSGEAEKLVQQDVREMGQIFNKSSQRAIAIMLSGVKGGKYDAMDLARGMKMGSAKRTHYGEMDFIQQLWNKVRDGFRRYSKRGKLR